MEIKKDFKIGFGIAIFVGAIIFMLLKLGWYSRADMQAKAQFSNLFLISVILISAFLFGLLYNYLKNEKH